MSLTPEQFNKLVTKDEFNELKSEFKDFGKKLDTITTVLDGIAKNYKDHETERTSNIAAHDRFERRIAKIEKKLEINAYQS